MEKETKKENGENGERDKEREWREWRKRQRKRIERENRERMERIKKNTKRENRENGETKRERESVEKENRERKRKKQRERENGEREGYDTRENFSCSTIGVYRKIYLAVREDQCFMELRNLLAAVLPETFLGLANCSAGVSTFRLVSKFHRYYDGRMIFYNSPPPLYVYKIEIQDLAT